MFRLFPKQFPSFPSNYAAHLAGAVGAVLIVSAAPAHAGTTTSFSFGNIVNGDTFGDALKADFGMDVIEDVGGNVVFKFKNFDLSNTGHFIGGIYFDDNASLLSFANLTLDYQNVGTVDFKNANANLPQGNNIGFVGDYGATKNGAASNGVQKNEALGVKIKLNTGKTYADLIAGLNSGTIKSGIHVQALANGKSDSYVSTPNTPPPPPPPAKVPESSNAMVMLGLAAAGVLETARRKRQS